MNLQIYIKIREQRMLYPGYIILTGIIVKNVEKNR